MSFELIEAEEAHYPKALMCRALGLSRSGHHAYSTRGPSRRALEEQQLDVLVAAIFAELAGRYGAPRIQQELRRRGSCTSRKRVAASLRRQRSEEHTSELQSLAYLVCRLLLEKKKKETQLVSRTRHATGVRVHRYPTRSKRDRTSTRAYAGRAATPRKRS